MRRDRINTIVPIGNGLCRVIVRSEKLARELTRIPGVQLRDEDAAELGWWVIFPEELRELIEPAFRRDEKTIDTRRQKTEQTSLLDTLQDDPDGDMLWAAAHDAHDAEDAEDESDNESGEAGDSDSNDD